jgi:hypothetical protein
MEIEKMIGGGNVTVTTSVGRVELASNRGGVGLICSRKVGQTTRGWRVGLATVGGRVRTRERLGASSVSTDRVRLSSKLGAPRAQAFRIGATRSTQNREIICSVIHAWA